MKLNIISLCRDSESYLPITFGNLAALERRYDVSYFFYENDSIDGTAALLRDWLSGRHGILVSETLNAKKFGQTKERERTRALVAYRNRILVEAARVPSDWTLLLDSDVEFAESLVDGYLACDDPDVAMYTPAVEFNRECHMCDPGCGRRAYYDTFAFRDRSDRRGMLLSCNPFWDDEDRHAWDHGRPVEVHCAFGGAALIRSDVLAGCRWQSHGDCEHVAFAEQVRAMGKILAVPTVKVATRADIGAANLETVEMQKRLLESPLLLRFWTERTRDILPPEHVAPQTS